MDASAEKNRLTQSTHAGRPGSQPHGWILGACSMEHREQPRIKSRQLFPLKSTQQQRAAFMALGDSDGLLYPRKRLLRIIYVF